jgi:hypothetical protein
VKEKRSLGFWAPILVLAAALVMLAVSTDAVDAARGGKGGGKSGGGSSAATLTVSPNPVPLGTNITISGSGFKAYQDVLINTSHLPSPQVTADGNGSFSFVYDYRYGPGNAGVQAYVMSRSSWVMVAQATFTICSTNPC